MPQRLEARDLEELALADPGEVIVHGGAGLGEVGLGALALRLGRPGRAAIRPGARACSAATCSSVATSRAARSPSAIRLIAAASPIREPSVAAVRSPIRDAASPATSRLRRTIARNARSAWSAAPGSARRRGTAASRRSAAPAVA